MFTQKEATVTNTYRRTGSRKTKNTLPCWFQTQLNTQAVFRQRPSNCSCNNHFYINYNHSHKNRFPSNVNGCDCTQLSSPFHWHIVKKTPSIRRLHRTSSGTVESLRQKFKHNTVWWRAIHLVTVAVVISAGEILNHRRLNRWQDWH